MKTLILMLLAVSCGSIGYGATRQQILEAVVMIKSDTGSCSGAQIMAPEGKTYVLSAAHCAHLADKDKRFTVIDAFGRSNKLKLVATAKNNDLMLIEGVPDVMPLMIALNQSRLIATFSHPLGISKTIETRGVLASPTIVGVDKYQIKSRAGERQCLAQPLHHIITEYEKKSGLAFRTCTEILELMPITAFVTFGSSGGPAVDTTGDLQGVIVAVDNEKRLGYVAPLADVQEFLKGR